MQGSLFVVMCPGALSMLERHFVSTESPAAVLFSPIFSCRIVAFGDKSV